MTTQTILAGEKLTQNNIESYLWKAADILRGAVRLEARALQEEMRSAS